MSKFKKTMNEKSLQDQLRIQVAATKRANKLVEYLKKEMEMADQEMLEVYERINFWVDYTAWLGNTTIRINGEEFTKEGSMGPLIERLSEKDKGLLSSIVMTIVAGDQSLESVLYLLAENKLSAKNEEYQLAENQHIRLSMN